METVNNQTAENFGLTESRLAEIRDTFSLFDKDGDGFVTTRDVAPILRALGFNPAEKQVTELVDQFDPDGEGVLAFDEFVRLTCLVVREGESLEELMEAFHVFDPNASGNINAGDLRSIMTNIGEKLTEAEVEEMMATVEVGERGEIKYWDFIQLLLSDKKT